MVSDQIVVSNPEKSSKTVLAGLQREPFQDTEGAFLILYPDRTKKVSIWQNPSGVVGKWEVRVFDGRGS